MFSFPRLSLATILVLLPGVCAAEEPTLVQQLVSEFHGRNQVHLGDAEAGYWFIDCGQLANGYRTGAAVFTEVNILVETLLVGKSRIWMEELGLEINASADRVDRKLKSIGWGSVIHFWEKADAILGLTSVLHFVKGLSKEQREEQMEIRGYGEHPIFVALNDVLTPSADPEDISYSLSILDKYSGEDAIALKHLYDVLLQVTGSPEAPPPDFFGLPQISPILNN